MSKTNVSNKIWDEIKDKELELFALPNQKVKDHVEPLNVPGTDFLYVKLASSAVLASLETCLKGFDFEQTEKNVIVKRKPAPLVEE